MTNERGCRRPFKTYPVDPVPGLKDGDGEVPFNDLMDRLKCIQNIIERVHLLNEFVVPGYSPGPSKERILCCATKYFLNLSIDSDVYSTHLHPSDQSASAAPQFSISESQATYLHPLRRS